MPGILPVSVVRLIVKPYRGNSDYTTIPASEIYHAGADTPKVRRECMRTYQDSSVLTGSGPLLMDEGLVQPFAGAILWPLPPLSEPLL